jgi:putative ABC transport system permease protein
MYGLALRTLRFRAGSFVATFVALFLGATIVMACGGLLESGIRNNAPPQRLAQASLLITGDRSFTPPTDGSSDPQGSVVLAERVPLDGTLVDRLRSLTGVRSAIGERTFDTALLGAGAPARARGHAWESAALTPYSLAAGAAPTGDDDVVLDQRLARRTHAKVGDRVEIGAHGGARSYRVAGIAAPAHSVPQATMFFTAAEAERLTARPGTVADIAIVTAPGTDLGALRKQVSRSLAGHDTKISTGDDRGAVEHPEILAGRTDLISLSAVFGGLAIGVAVFVVAGTIGLSVQQRHREFALMRAIGATPRQLRRMLLGETLLITVFSAGLAWFSGPLAGRVLFDALVDSGMVAETVEFSLGWIPAVTAGGALGLTALIGGAIGARRAVRAKPTEALAESAVQQRWFGWIRLLLGVLFLAGATSLVLVTALVLEGPNAASTAGPAVICAAVGIALLGPGLTKVLTKLFGGPLGRLTGTVGQLAMVNSRVRTVKMAAVVTPIMLAVAISTGELYIQTTQTDEAERVFTQSVRADAVLDSASGGLDPALLREVRALPGVADASGHTTSAAVLERPAHAAEGRHGLELQGIDDESGRWSTAVAPTAGNLGDLRGNTIALPDHLARTLHRGVGDTISIRLGDGTPTTVRVVALFKGRVGYESALTSLSLLAPHTTGGLPTRFLVRAAPGTDPTRLVSSLATWAKQHPGVRAQSRDALLDAHAEESKTQAWVNYLIVGMLALYTALSLVNTLVLATRERRGEFGLQRLSGATRGQVLHMTAVEAALATLIGVLLGTVAAAAAAVPFAVAATDSWLPTGPITLYLGVVGTVTVLTFAATLIPTWTVLRSRPVVAAGA